MEIMKSYSLQKYYPFFAPGDEGGEYQHLVTPSCCLIRMRCRDFPVKQEIISQPEIHTPSGDLLPGPCLSSHILAEVWPRLPPGSQPCLWVWLRLTVLEWQFGNRTTLETEKRKGPLMFRHF